MFFIATIIYIVKFDFEISQEFNANRFINWIINGKKRCGNFTFHLFYNCLVVLSSIKSVNCQLFILLRGLDPRKICSRGQYVLTPKNVTFFH